MLESLGHGEPTVVLVHGLGLNRHMWQWQVPALAQSHRVVTYDLCGHGDAALPPDRPTLALFSAQLAGILDRLSIETAAIVGFSLGGMIARRFAMDHPQRLTGLVIMHSPHRREPEARAAVQARADQARRHGPEATVDQALAARWFTDDFRAAHPEIMDRVRHWVMANRPDVYPEIYQLLVDGVDELVAPDPPIACPTLVITGGEDHGNSPAMARAIAGEIPGARTLIIDGLRHMGMMEQPERYNRELLAFLAQLA
jgi:pimeloyl-ACP methyl ester carboxylesterase